MVTNLTSLKWKKNVYYVSEGVIFDIASSERKTDQDGCGTLILDFDKAPDAIKNAKIGATVDLAGATEVFATEESGVWTSLVPWLSVEFSDETLNFQVPLQYLIEEGDTFTDGAAGQAHPDVFGKDYRNKFNQEVFDFIESTVEKLNPFDPTATKKVMDKLPAWLTCSGVQMSTSYAKNSFLKGKAWKEDAALKLKGDDTLVTFTGAWLRTPAGNACANIWNKERVHDAIVAVFTAKMLNALNEDIKTNDNQNGLSVEQIEAVAAQVLSSEASDSPNDKAAVAMQNITFDASGEVASVEFPVKASESDTWWEYEGEVVKPVWTETARELTSTVCLQEDGKNTGMAEKTYTITYTDTNEQSPTHGNTKTATETVTAEDVESCPLPQPEPEPEPEPEPTPEPTVADWDYIYDEASWNAANQEGKPLYKYHQNNLEEDLWNTTEGRAVNFNDRWYTGTFDGASVSCGTAWAADGVQKITINGTDYYTPIWGYDLSPASCEMFLDVAMTLSSGKIFEIETVSFSPDCVQCWQGAINSPGAVYPWAAVDVPTPFTGKIETVYDGGTPIYPWGDADKEFVKGYGIASIPTELGEQYNAETFDPSKLVFTLIPAVTE